MWIHPVYGANWTLTQPMYHLFFADMVSISLGFPYMVMLHTFKRKRHCSRFGVAMGYYGSSIVPGTVIVTSQCYGRYCSTEYRRTWAGHLSTPWLCEFVAITGCQWIDNLLDFNAICCIFLLSNFIHMIRRNCSVWTVLVVLNKCFGPSVLGHFIEPVARLTRHARRGKQCLVKWSDLLFQSATIVV